MTTTRYAIEGMSCHHCELSVQEELGELPGVESVHADHEGGYADVVSSAPLDVDAVKHAVDEAGYTLAGTK